MFDTEEIAASVYAQMADKLIREKNHSANSSLVSSPPSKSTSAHLKLINNFAYENGITLVDDHSPVFHDDSLLFDQEDFDFPPERHHRHHQQASVQSSPHFEPHVDHLTQLKIRLGRVIRSVTELNQSLMTSMPTSTSCNTTHGSSSSVSSNESTQDVELEMMNLLTQQHELTTAILAASKGESGKHSMSKDGGGGMQSSLSGSSSSSFC